MFPAGAGVILVCHSGLVFQIRVSQRVCFGRCNDDVFPAGAGVILNCFCHSTRHTSVSRRRGGDPIRAGPCPYILECFPQARG